MITLTRIVILSPRSRSKIHITYYFFCANESFDLKRKLSLALFAQLLTLCDQLYLLQRFETLSNNIAALCFLRKEH